MICKRATYQIKVGQEAHVEKLISDFMASAVERGGEDMVFYEVFRNDASRLYEHLMCFADEDAEMHHRENEHTKHFIEQMFPLCDEGPVFEDIHRVNGGICR